MNTLENNNRVMLIYNDGKEFFRKCTEIWYKIIELIGINNRIYFLKADDDDELFIIAVMYTKIQALFLKIIIDMDIIKL